MAAVEQLTTCGFCKSTLTDPLRLPCHHSFCRVCLSTNSQAGKVTCATCKKVSVVQGSVEKTFKNSVLSAYLIRVVGSHYDDMEINDDEKLEREGFCECMPQPKPAKKIAPNEPEQPEPIKMKLKLCFHCGKHLCEKCSTKHYNDQRDKPLKVLHAFQEGSGNILLTAQKLNQARIEKIKEYQQKKTVVSQLKLELTQRLNQEEKQLLDQLDAECKTEQDKIVQTNEELKQIETTREASKVIREKIMRENNMKRMVQMCNDFTKAQEEWKQQLQGDASRYDPKLETKLNFEPTKIKENLIGSLSAKRGNYKDIKQAKIPDKNLNNSKVCVVL